MCECEKNGWMFMESCLAIVPSQRSDLSLCHPPGLARSDSKHFSRRSLYMWVTALDNWESCCTFMCHTNREVGSVWRGEDITSMDCFFRCLRWDKGHARGQDKGRSTVLLSKLIRPLQKTSISWNIISGCRVKHLTVTKIQPSVRS